MSDDNQKRAEIKAAMAIAFAQLQAQMPSATWTDLERMIYAEGFSAGALFAYNRAQQIFTEVRA